MKLYFVTENSGKAIACFSEEEELKQWLSDNTVYIGDLDHPLTINGNLDYIGSFRLKSDENFELEIVPLEFGQELYDFVWKEFDLQEGDYLAAYDAMFITHEEEFLKRLEKSDVGNQKYERE